MVAGGKKGGSATGSSKARSPEQAKRAALAASLARARNRGLKLFEATLADGTLKRLTALDKREARKRLTKLEVTGLELLG